MKLFLFKHSNHSLKSNLLFDSLFHNHPDGVSTLDEQGLFLNANNTCEEILGCQVDELIGTSLRSFIDPMIKKDMVN